MSDQNLDIIIRTKLEAAGFEATKQQIAEVKAAMEANGGMNLEALRGFSDGVEKQVQLLLKRKEAIIDGAIGAKMQAEAAAADKALQQEIKALEAFEKKKQKELEAFQATEKKRATEQAAAMEEARRGKVLQELTDNQEEETKGTDKATEAKKRFQLALQGLNTEFPALGQVLRALASGWGMLAAAAAAAAGVVVSRLKEMGEARTHAASLAREIERLSAATTEFDTLLAQATAKRAAFEEDMAARVDAVNKLTKAFTAASEAELLNQRINEKLDDEILRRKIAEIDASNESPENKLFLKDKATKEARDRKEDERIEAIAKASRRDFINASAMEKQEKELRSQAAGRDEPVAAAQRNLEAAQQEMNKAEAFVKEQQRDVEANLKWIREGLDNPGGMFRNGYFWSKDRLKQEEQFQLDRESEFKPMLKTPKADLEAAQKALEVEEKKRQRLLDAAEEARRKAQDLMESGGTKREQYEQERGGRRAIQPWQQGTDEMERNRKLREAQEQEQRRKDSDLRKGAQDWQRNSQPGDAMPPEFQRFIRGGEFRPDLGSVESAGGSVVEAVAQVNVAVNEQFAAIREELERMRAEIGHGKGNNKAGLLG